MDPRSLFQPASSVAIPPAKPGFANIPQRVLGMPPKQAALYYLAIPMFLAFLSGWPQVGRTIGWSKPHALAFWAGMSFGGWYMNDVVTRLLAGSLRRRGVPLVTVLVLGATLASIPSDVVLRIWVHGYHAAFPYLPVDRPLPGTVFSLDKFFRTHVYGVLTWPLINLALVRLGGITLFGYETRHPTPLSTETAPTAPGLMAKLPVQMRGAVIALRAEQHYLRVYTASGECLILFRLSDAVLELGAAGLQVHRSHWVAHQAVKGTLGNRAAPRLLLVNDLEVPVSRSYRKSVEAAGML